VDEMARLAFRAEIYIDNGGSATYTVPAGTTAVFAAFPSASTSPVSYGTLYIAGVQIQVFSGLYGNCLKPLTANAGDIISCANNDVGAGGATIVGLVGFLYS
jgi:hypothetical protein